jgi:hypothetical protein
MSAGFAAGADAHHGGGNALVSEGSHGGGRQLTEREHVPDVNADLEAREECPPNTFGLETNDADKSARRPPPHLRFNGDAPGRMSGCSSAPPL